MSEEELQSFTRIPAWAAMKVAEVHGALSALEFLSRPERQTFDREFCNEVLREQIAILKNLFI